MGRLIQIIAPDGGMSFYEYDIMGRVVKIVDPLCYITEMEYDLNGNIIEIKASENRIFEYEYDKNNNLIKTINPLEEEAEFYYDSLNRTIKIINEGSYETEFIYDPVGRLLETKNALDEIMRNSYDLNGNRIGFEDPNGNFYSYEFDELNHLSKIVDPLLNETNYEYDESENLVKIIDALNNITEYEINEGNLIKKTINCKGRIYEFLYDEAGNSVKIIRPDATSYCFTYDSMKRIVSEISPKGLIREYSYNSNGKLEKVWDNAGNSMEYEYDLKGQLIKKTDVLERTETYCYNSLGKVTRAILFDTRENNFTYDLLGRLETFTDAEGKVTTYFYDAIGNLIEKNESKDNEERIFKYCYNLNRLVKSIDPLDAKTTFDYDHNGNLTSLIDAKENSITYSYNALNLVNEFKDKNGNITRYAFDPLKRLIEIEDPEGGIREYVYDCVGNLIKEIDPLNNEKNYEYDDLDNLVKVIYPEGGEISYKYDAHRVLEEVRDQIGAVTQYETNLNDMVTKITRPNGGIYCYSYDELSRLKSVITPDELIIEFVYDDKGNLSEESDNLGRNTSYSYDIMHRLKKVTDGLGNKTRYFYDAFGNMQSMVNPKGFENSYSYDLMGRLLTSEDPIGKITQYEYDEIGNLERVIKPGARITSYSHDGNGNVIENTDPMEYVRTFLYDGLNRLIERINPVQNSYNINYDLNGNVTSLINEKNETIEFSYDGNDNLIRRLDEKGYATEFNYDLKDRLIKVEDALGVFTFYSYDSEDNLKTLIDGNGNITNYSYDLMNRLTETLDAKGFITKNEYDIAGRLKETLKPNGDKVSYDYDKINQLVEKRYNGNTAEPMNYYYNELGERVTMNDSTGEYSYKYDPLGRLIETTQGDGNTVKYEYDLNDQLSSIIYPDGKRVDYTYDKNDRLIQVVDSNKTVDYTYDEMNRVLTAKRSTGAWTKYIRDEKGQVTRIENTRTISASPGYEFLSTFDYIYDEKGNIVNEVSMEQNVRVVRDFSYNDLNQLVEFNEKEGLNVATHYQYSYDNFGNRISLAKTGLENETISYEYNVCNELILENSSVNGKTIYRYNENGNLTSQINPNKYEDLKYEYTVENRLKAVRNGARILMAASYNGDNDRVFQAYRKNNKAKMSQDQSYFADPKETWYKDVKNVFSGPTGNMMFQKEDGTLYAGGNNDYGMLGTKTTSGLLSSPQEVNLTNVVGEVVKVEIGAYHSLILDDAGNVYGTGLNNYGQLGQGNTTNLSVFTRINFGINIIIEDITAGGATSYALDADGRLWGFGSGGAGSLGDGNAGLRVNHTPRIIETGVVKITASKSSRSYSSDYYNAIYVLKGDGRLYSAGLNNYGQQGNGTTTNVTTFQNAAFFNNKIITQIEAAATNIKVLTSDGNVYVCGQNIWGELGIGTKSVTNTFNAMILPQGMTCTRIFRTNTTTFVELSDGMVWACGSNDSGDLGYRSNQSSTIGSVYDPCLLTNMVTLEQVQLDTTLKTLTPTNAAYRTTPEIYKSFGGRRANVKSVSGAWNGSFMADGSGVLRTTGGNGNYSTSEQGETGSNQYQFHKVSRFVLKEEPYDKIREIYSGPVGNIMFLREDGILLAAGNNDYGMLGTIRTSGKLPSPQMINMRNIEGNIVKVEMGANHTLILDDRGNAYSSGYNNYGQLGQGNTTTLYVFTKINFGVNVVIQDITVGGATSYALDTSGNLWGFGSGGAGSLGDGNAGLRINHTPTIILTNVVKMTASKSSRSYSSDYYNAIYALKEDGRLYSAGLNNYGQQGNGTTTNVTTFQNAAFFNNKVITQIEAAATNIKVLTSDGNVYVCGQNIWGELGLGTKSVTNTFNAMILPQGMTCTRIFRTNTTTFVELSDGMLWGCGTNDSGDLGYRSSQSSTIGSAYDPCRLTNMVTLEQVQNNGSLTTLVPTNANYRTSPDIYSRGNVVSVSGGWNESFMIDSSTELRAAGGGGNYDTSLVAETGSNQYQFHRMVITVDRLNGEAVIPEELEKQLDTGYELTYYVNDINRANTEVLVDYSKRDNSQNSYTYGLERLWGELKQGNSAAVPEIYLYDGRGSVTQVVNNSNALNIQYRYDPFGVMKKGEPTQNAIYGYNAEDYNPTIESQYLRARYYKPGSGRFSTRDEYLGDVYDPLSLNLYSYVKNNPVNYIDPSGYKTDIDELRAEKIYLANLQKSQVSAPAPNNSSSANLTAEALAELLAATTIVAWVFTGVIPPAAAGVVGSSLREALVPGLTLAVEAAEAANNYLISRGKSVYQLSYVEREALLKKQIEAIIQKSCENPDLLEKQRVNSPGSPIGLMSLDQLVNTPLGQWLIEQVGYYGSYIWNELVNLWQYTSAWSIEQLARLIDKIKHPNDGKDNNKSSDNSDSDSGSSDPNNSNDPNKNNINATKIDEIIDDIPKSCKILGKCDDFANALEEQMIKSGIQGEKIKIETTSIGIYSDKAGQAIAYGKDAYHYGIKIGNIIYDNMTSGGMNYYDWLKDLGVTDGFAKIVENTLIK